MQCGRSLSCVSMRADWCLYRSTFYQMTCCWTGVVCISQPIEPFHIQGKVTISNDGATIMKLLEVVHPAAKVLVDISLSQDSEVCQSCLASNVHARCMMKSSVYHCYARCDTQTLAQVGDGTTTVVLLASEFLKEAKSFIDDGVHPRVRLQLQHCFLFNFNIINTSKLFKRLVLHSACL